MATQLKVVVSLLMDNRLNLNECTYRTLEKEILGKHVVYQYELYKQYHYLEV